MKINAVRFRLDQAGLVAERAQLEIGAPHDLERLREESHPAAMLIQGRDLKKVARFSGVVHHKGKKHPKRGLAYYLLGASRERIPSVDGRYQGPRQVARSIRAFLERAVEAGESRTYMIGATKAVFDTVWKRLSGRAVGGVARDAARPTGPAGRTSRLLAILSSRHPVDDDLAQKYVGRSEDAQWIRQLITTLAAEADEPVLILGDTGTGKEVIAGQIHARSARKGEPFVTVNCGAIPGELFESELFGYVRGAFTGAIANKIGFWESAGRGTLFLDEVGDLELRHQVKILRALQEGKIQRIGESKDRPVAARIIAATNRDLFSMMQTGAFRKDLYYRLRGFPICPKPLRDKLEDIPLLANHFWKSITHDDATVLPRGVLNRLQDYRWPGNVRELRMVLNSLHAIFGADSPTVEDLEEIFLIAGQSFVSGAASPSDLDVSFHRTDCLRHLRRVNEALHATRVTILPMTRSRRPAPAAVRTIEASLEMRRSELERLCEDPSLFHSEPTFSAVWQHVGKLSLLQEHLQADLRKARAYWDREVSEDLRLVLAAVFGEIARVLERV